MWYNYYCTRWPSDRISALGGGLAGLCGQREVRRVEGRLLFDGLAAAGTTSSWNKTVWQTRRAGCRCTVASLWTNDYVPCLPFRRRSWKVTRLVIASLCAAAPRSLSVSRECCCMYAQYCTLLNPGRAGETTEVESLSCLVLRFERRAQWLLLKMRASRFCSW